MSKLAGTLLVALFVLTGCGSSDEEPSAGSSSKAPVGAVNPVEVLKDIPGCDPGDTVPEGYLDMNDNRWASCDVNGADITARAVDPSEIGPEYQDAITQDDAQIIHGDGFYLNVGALPEKFADGTVDVEAIAEAVGGEVVQVP